MKIQLNALGCITPEQISANIEHSKSLGYPRAVARPRPPLAIVGGGISAKSCLDELRAWPGDIWGINHAFTWLRDHGVRSTFYTADPRPLDGLDIWPGDDVLIATYSDADLFEACKRGNIKTYQHWENGVVPGVTSAGTALTVAPSLGYAGATYFGCESSFEGTGTHVFGDDIPADLIRVRCDGQDFLSKLEFLHQAMMLATAIRGEPKFYRARGGGLLAALVRSNDYDITHGTQALHDMLRSAEQVAA